MFTDLILAKTTQFFHSQELNLLLRYCVEPARQNIENESRKIKLQMDMDELGRETRIFCDQPMVQHAIGEVLSNAIKYTPDGKNVFVTGKIVENYAVIEIKDEGTGIPYDKAEQIFEPLFPLKTTRRISQASTNFRVEASGWG